jgi:hypothetical protein
MREQKRADFFFFAVIKSHKPHTSKDKTLQLLLQLLELPSPPASRPALLKRN